MSPFSIHKPFQPDDRNETPAGMESLASTSSIPGVNVLTGSVLAIHPGLTRTSIRVRVGRRTDLRVRWPDDRNIPDVITIGRPVTATVSSEAVRLETGIFRRTKSRWNRWIGRVVWTAPNTSTPMTIVKVHGEGWTLQSSGPIHGATQPLRTWDIVNVVVDPERISLTASPTESYGRNSAPNQSLSTCPAEHEGLVWMRALIEDTRRLPAGILVKLNVGCAPVSALIDFDAVVPPVGSGSIVQLCVGQGHAWLRLHGNGSHAVPCSLLFQSETDPGARIDQRS